MIPALVRWSAECQWPIPANAFPNQILLMKTSYSNRLRRSGCQFTSLVILAAVTSSCATSKKSDPSTHVAPAIGRSWVKVKSKPPTWYPRGVPADHPTDFYSGEWFYLEDTADTRFFIPIHGLLPDKRKALKAEAMAARHPDTIQRITSEERVRKSKGVLSAIIVAPFMAIGEMYQ